MHSPDRHDPASTPAAGSWHVTCQHTQGKHPDQSRNEDQLLVAGPWHAVIDGATDKSGRGYEFDGAQISSGRFAALITAQALAALPGGLHPHEAVARLTEALDHAIRGQHPDLPAVDRPSVRLVVFDASQDLLWWIGDPWHALRHVDGSLETHQDPDPVDEILIPMRVLVLDLLRAAGRPWDPHSGQPDPGREAIMPVLRDQQVFVNKAGRYGYGLLNGTPVPAQFVGIRPVPAEVTEIVLASDGYPRVDIAGQLDHQAAEKHVTHMVALDPWCASVLAGTKGLTAGNLAHDDRSWLQLARRTAC